VLGTSKIRHAKGARAVFFELPDGDRWLFDPRSPSALFSRTTREPDDDALVVRCDKGLLARLVTDDAFELKDDDIASFTGNIDDLLPMAAAVAEQSSVLGIRAGK
jgi:hypothetical protein